MSFPDWDMGVSRPTIHLLNPDPHAWRCGAAITAYATIIGSFLWWLWG